jgi:iron complex transport system substrate-binding protein
VRIFVYIRLLAFTILVVFAIAACKGKIDSTANPALTSSNPTDCQTIQHEIGETKVCGQPRRIVVLENEMLELLLTLGIQPVGISTYSSFHQGDFDNPSQQIPYLGDHITSPLANVGKDYSPSYEAILKVQPDLILGHSWNDSQYETLSKIAPTLLFNPVNAEKNLRAITQIFDRSEQAEQVLAETEQRIATARSTFAPLVATHPKVLLLTIPQMQDITLTWTATLCSSVIEKLGFQLVFPPGLDNKSKLRWDIPISLETLPQLEADSVILLGINYGAPSSMDNFENHQLAELKQAWQENVLSESFKASKAGRVYFIPYEMCSGISGSISTELYLEELKKQLLPPN